MSYFRSFGDDLPDLQSMSDQLDKTTLVDPGAPPVVDGGTLTFNINKSGGATGAPTTQAGFSAPLVIGAAAVLYLLTRRKSSRRPAARQRRRSPRRRRR